MILEVFARSVIEYSGELGIKLVQFVKVANIDSSISSKFTPEQQKVLEQINSIQIN